MDGLTALGAYTGLRRSVIDPVTGNPVVTSAPTGEVVSRSNLLPLGVTDEGRMTLAVPQALLGAYDAFKYPGQVARGEKSVFDPATGHVSQEAMDAANGLAALGMTGGLAGAPRGAIGSGPIRQFEIGDRFAVSAKDFGKGGRSYEIRARDPAGTISEPIGQAQLVQRPDGRWETGTITVDPAHRGQGAATALYKAVEQDTGQPRVPSGSLLEDGYRFWKARDPEAVQYHQHVGDGVYLSPRRLTEMLDTAPTPADRAAVLSVLEQVPSAGRTPEALARQFAIPALIGGGAVAADMLRPGEAQAAPAPLGSYR